MSVSSDRSCGSPLSSNDWTNSAIKLKRRWIAMSHSDDEAIARNSKAVDSSVETPTSTGVRSSAQEPKVIRVVLPDDPRSWTKRDVQTWVKFMTSTYDIDVTSTKFDMNGKALCMMTIEMFVKRVPNGGKFLYKDFRLRLHRAVFFQEQPKPDYSKMSPLEMLTITTGKYFS